MREIRTLRAMWRALETGTRQLLNGHEGGNPGYKPRMSLRANAPVLDPTRQVSSDSAKVKMPGRSLRRTVEVYAGADSLR